MHPSMFSGGRERVQWEEMGWLEPLGKKIKYKQTNKPKNKGLASLYSLPSKPNRA